MYVGFGSTVSACTAELNGDFGIRTEEGCTVTACTSQFNPRGFVFGDDCTIVSCTSIRNTAAGIECSSGSTVKDCTLSGNKVGIITDSRCHIISNNVSKSVEAGIQTTGQDNRIDSNHSTLNGGYGILSSGPTVDVIVRNTCFGNGGVISATATADYSPKSGPKFGVLSQPGDPNPSAWANF